MYGITFHGGCGLTEVGYFMKSRWRPFCVPFRVRPPHTRHVRTQSHTVGYAGFVPPAIGGVRDQICKTYGLTVNCVRQVEFG